MDILEALDTFTKLLLYICGSFSINNSFQKFLTCKNICLCTESRTKPLPETGCIFYLTFQSLIIIIHSIIPRSLHSSLHISLTVIIIIMYVPYDGWLYNKQ